MIVNFEDISGDGKADMISKGQSGLFNAGWVYVALSTGTGYPAWNWESGVKMIDDNSPMWFADVNDDGKADMISKGQPDSFNSGWLYVSLSTGAGFQSWTWNSGRRILFDNDSLWFSDVNGDGKADMIAKAQSGLSNAGWMYVSLSIEVAPPNYLYDNAGRLIYILNSSGEVQNLKYDSNGNLLRKIKVN